MSLSVALCTYNGERFLREQLDSIAQQTLLPDELVVCDDRSGDATLGILQKFKERSPFPVHIHQNEKNLGSTKNFEKAISLCSGDIIALSDQDDVWKPHKLQRLVETLQANPGAGYAFSNADLVDENRKPLDLRLWDSIGFKDEIKDRFLNGDQFRCFLKQHIVTGATMAFRSSVGKLAMPFPTGGRLIHDGLISFVSSAAGFPGVTIDESLIYYRQHAGQQIGAPSKPRKKKQLSLWEMYRELKKNQQFLFADWEGRCQRILKFKDILKRVQASLTTPVLEQNLAYLNEFETHFINRRKILTSRNLERYRLILREAFSGRYAEFSDSWRSMFRDLFL